MTCDCEVAPNSAPHPRISYLQCMTCPECEIRWDEHTIGRDGDDPRTIIAADWEPTGWRLFVYTQDRTPDFHYLELEHIAPDYGASEGCWGEGGVRDGYYLDSVPRDIFLNRDTFVNGPCDLVIENAHLLARRETSLAQVYWPSELFQLYDICTELGIRIFEFPAPLAKRARLEALFGAGDKARDPEAVVRFCLRRRDVILREFNPLNQLLTREGEPLSEHQQEEASRREYMNDVRNECNFRLNVMRQYQYQLPANLIEENFISARADIEDALGILDNLFGTPLPENAPEEEVSQRALLSTFLNIESTEDNTVLRRFARNGNYSHPRMTAVMAAYVGVFERGEGMQRNLRRFPNQDGRFIGIKMLWDRVWTMSPFHGSYGGVPRANLMWMGLFMAERNSGRRIHRIGDDEAEYHTRQSHRRNWRKAVKLLLRTFRDEGENRGE